MVGGEEIIRIMGSRNAVSIYGIKAGITHVRCMLPATGSTAECEIEVEAVASLEFEQENIRVMPGQTKTIAYSVTPATASIRWQRQTSTGDEYVTLTDMPGSEGKGEVSITGIKVGTTSIMALSSYGSMKTITAVCSWDYDFKLSKTDIKGIPEGEQIINYTVHRQRQNFR